MADIGEKLGPVAEALVEPGETLEAFCVGSNSGLMSSRFALIAVTDRRLIVQECDRKQRPKGDQISIGEGEVASASSGGGGGWGSSAQSAIMDKTSLTIKIKTTGGERLKLMVGRGTGPLGGMMGGETQRAGVDAVLAFLERNTAA